jgi:hypothetical protein
MARITNLFRDRLYVFSSAPEIYENEQIIISDIFEKEGLKKPKTLRFLNANINNDLFLITNSDGQFCVKLSLDKNNSKLKKEFDILKNNIDRKITSFPIAYGVLENMDCVEYSIVGYLPIPNLYDFGLSPILESENSIPYLIENLARFDKRHVKETINDHFAKYLNFDILKIPEVDVKWIENHAQIREIVKNQILYLQKIIKEKLVIADLFTDHFCHGELNYSTILPFGEQLHAINFENSYLGDKLFELYCLRYELFYTEKMEQEFVNKIADINGEPYCFEKIKKTKELASYFSLLKIMVDYLTEVYILKGSRQNKIIHCAFKLSKNYDSFYQLPDFDKKLKPLAEFFVESVI